MNWEDVSKTARDTMDELGDFGPTVHADARQVKGYTLDCDGSAKCYWSSADLRRIAASCIEVADWLDKRAEAAQKE